MPEWQESPLGLVGLHILWPEGAPGLQYRHRARCGAAHTIVGLPVRPGAPCWVWGDGRGPVERRGEDSHHLTPDMCRYHGSMQAAYLQSQLAEREGSFSLGAFYPTRFRGSL